MSFIQFFTVYSSNKPSQTALQVNTPSHYLQQSNVQMTDVCPRNFCSRNRHIWVVNSMLVHDCWLGEHVSRDTI